MMRCYRLLLFLFVLLCACQAETYEANVPAIPLTLDTLTDDYDGIEVEKIRRIFRKGVRYHYRAVYADADGTIISDNSVVITPTGQRWEIQPERQDVVEIVFGYTEEEKARVLANPINKTYPAEERWTTQTSEGIIENVNEVWMHPIRHNQYIFTEVAAFPEIKLPPVKDKKWRSGLSGLGGWGDWDGADISCEYEILGQELVMLPIGRMQCWAVEATATFELGTSTSLFHFHEDFGFVKMSYYNYLGESLVFVLDRVEKL